MATKGLKIMLLGALVATAACSKKPAELPPPPPAAAPAPEAPAPVTPTVVPGSVADFLAQAGSDRVFFAYDSFELDDAAKATLGKQAAWLVQYGSVKATIEGHADERGTREYNLALGERRATAVKNFLVGQGVGADRVTTISYGKERPAVEGSDEAAWSQNRRGVTVLTGAAE